MKVKPSLWHLYWVVMAKYIYDWEITESNVVQRILKALKHSDAVVTKSEFNSLQVEYVISYSNNYYKLHLSKEELVSAYSAAQKYKYFSDVTSKIMAGILGATERGEKHD